MIVRPALACGALALILLAGPGCRSVYYQTMEQLGQHKRDILVDRVGDARDEQAEAKTQFRTALQAFADATGFDGGDLRRVYDELRRELDRCRDEAADVRARIASVEDVADALFREWEAELEEYSSDELRARSAARLEATRGRYEALLGAMHRAEQRMDPVLAAFNDQVLSLKHELNAEAIASLQDAVVRLEDDVEGLLAEMEAAIAEADAFIAAMGDAG